MPLPDLNVLVYAHREDSTVDHPHRAAWLTDLATRKEPFALSVLALSAVVRITCRRAGASGKLVADAQHAAVAIEHGCTLVTTDSDFDRFPGLRWRHPLRP